MEPTIRAQGAIDHPVSRTQEGHYRLSAERTWLVEGDDEPLLAIEAVLSPAICERVGSALLLRFGNAVGTFDAGPLGRLVVHSDKWEESHFDTMLADITDRMTLLPFAAGTGAQLPYDRSITTEYRVLYHAFVYLRHLFSASAPTEDRLIPALRLILEQPHERFERITQWSALHAVQHIAPRALLGIASPTAHLTRAPAATGIQLTRILRGHLPGQIEETRVQSTVDVPENAFVKAFLGQVLGIVDKMRAIAVERRDSSFGRRILADCDLIARELAPLARHALWKEVSPMRRLPIESPVLQRRHGYKQVLRHFIKLRLTARLPLRPDTTVRLLEIKDIAELYEIWAFFELERQATLALRRPPLEAAVADVDDVAARLGWGLRVRWDGGVALFYNLTYSQGRESERLSYSLPLRPDVVLRIAHGPNAGDHLFDAKFKLRRLEDAVQTTDEVDDAEEAAERRGIFKRADLYKMHTYRDAIATACSVWILYPGTEFRFFDAVHGCVQDSSKMILPATGVGAIPLAPESSNPDISALLGKLLFPVDEIRT